MSNKTMKNIEMKKTPRGHEYPVGYEFFYEDGNGNLQDADIHNPILEEGDDWAATQVSIQVADRLGLKKIAALLREQDPSRQSSS